MARELSMSLCCHRFRSTLLPPDFNDGSSLKSDGKFSWCSIICIFPICPTSSLFSLQKKWLRSLYRPWCGLCGYAAGLKSAGDAMATIQSFLWSCLDSKPSTAVKLVFVLIVERRLRAMCRGNCSRTNCGGTQCGVARCGDAQCKGTW